MCWSRTSARARWTGWALPGSTSRNSTRGSSSARSRASAKAHPIRTSKCMKTWRNARAAPASTTGFWDGPPTISGAALGDSNTGMHLAIGLLTALIAREKSGKGQKVAVSMQDACLNLCRVKLRDQERLEHVGHLEEYPQYPNGKFGDTVPRDGNAGGGGQPGWVLKCKGWETDPNAYIYFTIQEQNWGPTCDAIGHPEWKADPAYTTAR